MIGTLRVLGLIPARGGSKGVPRKNVVDVAGRPLLAWTVDAALASRSLDHVIVSTDDEEIAKIASSLGCDVPFRRPAAFGSDTASAVEVALHAADEVAGYDVLVLLQPTSPLRTPADIDATCGLLRATGTRAAVTVAAAEESPYWMYHLDSSSKLEPVIDAPAAMFRRQDLPPVYVLNGAVYAIHVEELRSARTFVPHGTVAHVMPRARSLDIDTNEDLEAFRRLVCEA